MDIRLNKNWKIKTLERNNLALEEQGSNRGFFGNLQDALESYLNQKIMRADAESIQELLNFVKKLKEELSEVLKPLKLKIVEEK